MKSYTVGTVLVGMILLGWMTGLGLAQTPEAKPQAPAAKTEPESQPPVTLAAAAPTATPGELAQLSAVSAPRQSQTLGLLYDESRRSDDPTRYKYQVELTSAGAGIASVTLSEFDNRHHENPEPLKLLGPIVDGKRTIVPLACQNLKLAYESEEFGPTSFPLDRLSWKLVGDPTPDEVRFEAVIGKRSTEAANGMGTPILRLVKTYRLAPGTYDLECGITAENLADRPIKVQFDVIGASGIEREAARMEDRKVIGGFLDKKDAVTWARKEMVSGFWGKTFLRQVGLRDSTESFRQAMLSGDETARGNARYDVLIGRNLSSSAKPARFLWAGLANKYFVSILRPIPTGTDQACEWIGDQTAWFHNPDGDSAATSGDENISTVLTIQPIVLTAAGTNGSTRQLNFQMYLGPKDRELFSKTPLYKQLAYFYTIDFMSCCCPAWVIRPLAFGILWMMKAMYGVMGPLGNYGVVIMILVFVVRLLLHPITKKSQISMSAMQKLGPKMEQLKAQYADNPMEMQKKVREMYRETGVNPAMGIAPIMLQMPIWIALWSAVDSSIDLRGAGFLPFWITDLSAPDAIFRFKEVAIPLVGWKIDSINLLPLLMGVVMYVQQKMMPTPGAQTNPQVAQQQKIMLFMMPLLFPLMLYTGPSGVNLYIMSSMAAGVIEQKIIKKHIEQRDAEKAQGLVPVTSKTGGKVKKPKVKPMFKINR